MSVLLSLQALVFVENPLHNEPGFEKEKGLRNNNYNNILLYQNFNTAIVGMINKIPNTFDYFLPIITKSFIDNIEHIKKKIENNLDKQNKYIEFDVYSMKETLDYLNVQKLITNLYNDILLENSLN
tara:strand:- start:529 stop:906 length:378 start_codon:yes stop_codon:yes gene_type:complete